MEGKRPEMIGILDAARFSERSADSGRGKEPRLCPAPIPAMESLLIGLCDWKDYERRVHATAHSRPNVKFLLPFPVVTV
jgi:hypothetical protein